jgi:hypothetical protein
VINTELLVAHERFTAQFQKDALVLHLVKLNLERDG